MSDLKLSVLINAIDKFSAPAQKIANVSEKMASRLHDGQKALHDMGKKGQAVERMQKLKASLGKTAAAMDVARKRTAQLGRELAATTKPTKRLQQEFDQARKKSNALKKTTCRTPPRAWGRPSGSRVMTRVPANTPTGVGKTVSCG